MGAAAKMLEKMAIERLTAGLGEVCRDHIVGDDGQRWSVTSKNEQIVVNVWLYGPNNGRESNMLIYSITVRVGYSNALTTGEYKVSTMHHGFDYEVTRLLEFCRALKASAL